VKQTRVKKLIIELSGKDVELSIAEAKELYDALGQLFEEKVRERIIREPYIAPIWPRRPWITWCGERPHITSRGTGFELSGRETIRCQLKAAE